MKKLRLFDSLKFIVAVVVATFILNVAHADTTINSVIAYGKTEQSGTPTPTAPVPIMTNNGVLKVRPNLYGGTYYSIMVATSKAYSPIAIQGDSWTADGTRRGIAKIIKVKPNTTYTFSYSSIQGANYFNVTEYASIEDMSSYSNAIKASDNTTFTTSANTNYLLIGVWGYPTPAAGTVISVTNPQLEQGSTATTSIYADGMVETIRDAAGHTATAQMLLGINDTYRDEQNINTGAITRKVGVKVLDGTETTTWTVQATRVYTSKANIGLSGAKKDTNCISTHFGSSGGVNIISINAYGNVLFFYNLENLGITSVAQWNQYLAEQYAAGTPVIVVYPLETETTENVTTQQMTTAPVRQTAGSILGMPIEVVLGDGTREWVSEIITIATTKYNEESFAPVKTDLSDAMDAVDDVVTRTMTQAQAIDQIANEKQTRPDEGCTAKYCLLVEDEDGTPHWYPIAGADEANPTNP